MVRAALKLHNKLLPIIFKSFHSELLSLLEINTLQEIDRTYNMNINQCIPEKLSIFCHKHKIFVLVCNDQA